MNIVKNVKMKIIITETQKKHLELNLHLYRRLPDIKRELNYVLESLDEEYIIFKFDYFLHVVAFNVSLNVVDLYDRSQMSDDKYITFRNQIIQFVKNEFYDQIKQMYINSKKPFKNINL